MLQLKDLSDFQSQLKYQSEDLFVPGKNIFIARAPSRLDVMGGIADYSGSLVLETTLNEATFAAVQKRDDDLFIIRTHGTNDDSISPRVEFSKEQFFQNNRLKSPEQIGKEIKKDKRSSWSSYVLGCLAVLLNQGLITSLNKGLSISIFTNIRLCCGVASSAALELASMFAVSRALDIKIEPLKLASLCQIVENRVVGAPCGIMDQVTSAIGQAGKLLVLKCQPHDIIKMIQVPKGYQFLGINSAVKHSIGGSAYTNTRISTFIGRKIAFKILAQNGLPLPKKEYLCNLTPETWHTLLKSRIPDTLYGKDFLEQFETHDDPVTSIKPDILYLPRSRTEHPILENDRVKRFIDLIEISNTDPDDDLIIEAGKLMYESHESYSKNCGLGSEETDLIVYLIQKHGPENGFFGAKITGGGSGGTVAVLAANGTEKLIQNIADQYQKKTGLKPDVFTGTSPSAYQAGILITDHKSLIANH